LLVFHGWIKRTQRNNSQIEISLSYIKSEVEETKKITEQKADKEQVQALEREVEELRNRSRRNNLVFYNVPEKAEGDDCIGFMQNLIASHMGLETLCGQVEIERAHRTPTRPPSDSGERRPRPRHVAFLRYTDKMKVLTNAAARLKDNPLGGKTDWYKWRFCEENPRRKEGALSSQETSEEEAWRRFQGVYRVSRNFEIHRC